jgi:hypothetical protein
LTLIKISYSKEELEVIVVNSPHVATPNSLQISNPSYVERLIALISHCLQHNGNMMQQVTTHVSCQLPHHKNTNAIDVKEIQKIL